MRWLALAVLTFGLLVPAALAAPPALPADLVEGSWPGAATTPGEYRESIRSALADLETDGPGSAERVAARLRSLAPIALPDGGSVSPDLEGVLTALEYRPADLTGARVRLRALLVELDRAESGPAIDWGSDPRERLLGILVRPEFRPTPEPDPLAALYLRVWKTLGEWFGSIFGPLWDWLAEQWNRLWEAGGKEVAPVAGSVAGLALLLGVVVWVVRSLRRAVGPEVARLKGAREAAGLSSERMRDEALRLLQAGEFRGAMRALYLAALLRWDELGKLRFDRSLTNREVLARARGSGDAVLVQGLSPLVERFDRFWYGGAPCSAEDYAEFARLASAAWETGDR